MPSFQSKSTVFRENMLKLPTSPRHAVMFSFQFKLAIFGEVLINFPKSCHHSSSNQSFYGKFGITSPSHAIMPVQINHLFWSFGRSFKTSKKTFFSYFFFLLDQKPPSFSFLPDCLPVNCHRQIVEYLPLFFE